jgi:predicted MFS family arabinose efflux permease
LLAPSLMRRVRDSVLASSVVAGAALVVSGFAADALVFGIARTLFGVASGVALVAAAVQTLEFVEARHRGGASAIMWAGIGLGLAFSATAAGWLVHGTLDWRIASFATGIVTAIAGVGYGIAARGAQTAAAPSRSAEQSQPRKPQHFVFLCISYFGFGFAYIAYATFIVASIDARLGGNAHTTVELLWALYGVASVVGTLAIGSILDRPIGRWAIAFAGTASTLGCAAAFVWPVAAIPSAVLVGLGLTATPAAATAFARARSTTAGAPAAIALVTVAVGLGQLFGPLAAGVAADAFGLGSVALLACSVYLLQAAFGAVDALY